jgi:hypothetical protein
VPGVRVAFATEPAAALVVLLALSTPSSDATPSSFAGRMTSRFIEGCGERISRASLRAASGRSRSCRAKPPGGRTLRRAARRVRGVPCGYDSLTSNTHRLLPLSFDSLSATWTGRPKMPSKLSFWYRLRFSTDGLFTVAKLRRGLAEARLDRRASRRVREHDRSCRTARTRSTAPERQRSDQANDDLAHPQFPGLAATPVPGGWRR